MGFALGRPAARPLLAPLPRRRGHPPLLPGRRHPRRPGEDRPLREDGEPSARCSRWRPARARPSSPSTCSSASPTPGQLRRALFVCDRDELRTQALRRFQNVFGADAAEVYRKPTARTTPRTPASSSPPTRPSDVDSDDGDANFLTDHYPENYFSHIVIDECHRSAWGKWSQVLTRNPNAVQIGLTATPRQLEITERDHGGRGRRRDHRRQPRATSASRSTSTTWPRASRTATWPPARS